MRSCAHHFFDPEVIFLYFSQEIGEGDAIIKEETIPEKWGHHEKAEDDAKKKTQKELNGDVYPMITFLFTRPPAAYAKLGGGGGRGARQCSVLRNLSTQ